MSELTATWPCPECDERVPLTAYVKSSDTIRDETGKVTGITLTPEVDTAPAVAHMVDAHAWTPTT
ncbi:hypothetical protein [Curtobacterium sp. VKM Ac-2884]|uniref:hypothetical protein n=1 Tax=Curtobacterium sp. VKM Ac-2884 TaxID=2783818 RepID=UPI00188CBF19|nr:hypothetical protein [Curtobacterium sp. VKM Ac-2884]MBF4603751.1 hypothetical protein [Curtobacterium sp. VKM Ac-2884]